MFASDEEPYAAELLIAPGATLILVAAVIEPLRAANRLLGREAYAWRLTSPDGAPALTTAGLPAPVAGRFEPEASRAPLFLVASYGWERVVGALAPKLHLAARRRAFLAGVDSGVWLLARAGLLAGRRVAAHWEDVEAMREAHPDVLAAPARFEIDGARVTASGALSTLDLMLEIVRRTHGYPLAYAVSKLFLYDAGRAEANGPPASRPAADAPRISAPALRAQDRRVAAAAERMERALAQPEKIAAIAAAVGLSERQLRTRFLRVFGVSPRDHYLALRLEQARRRFVETETPITEIALGSGFSSPGAFSRRYRDAFGERPIDTRKTARRRAR